jgi:hypothetical protein
MFTVAGGITNNLKKTFANQFDYLGREIRSAGCSLGRISVEVDAPDCALFEEEKNNLEKQQLTIAIFRKTKNSTKGSNSVSCHRLLLSKSFDNGQLLVKSIFV